ncbi:MAG: DUF6340 family protein [Bacteroidales bacterium]|jgi:tetratricopeptide (TPR) repeat protein|nr:DUF6340 family protein [Bacteroidales bacterium]
MITNYKRVTLFVLLPLLIAIFVACNSVSYINVEVLKPAEIKLPNKYSNAAVVVSSYNNDQKYTGIEALMFTKDVVDSYHEQCSEAVKSSIGYSYTFESSDYIPLFKLSRKLNGDTIPFLSVETLKGIRAKYNTDIVIGLDYLRPGLAFTGETRKPVNVQRGYLEGLWRLYDARTGEIIDTHSFSDSVTIRGYQGDLAYYDFVQYIVLSGLDKKAFDNGVSYARRIAPYWGVETRKLYYQGHIEMGRALSFAQDNKWRKAEHIWKELSKRSNKKLKASCYFNLAVASEVMGDYDKAFEYLKKSKEIKSTSLINEYRDKLRKRKSDVLKLDYQMRH